ncbi:alkylation response protein AidB-like acyl-CoA dehydrogenase [Zhongshania antarctica]|uniref:Alkylation response protein AidB-like acyl-CoA dehydrogenase n=1 Tax=Zhongshania antarctica TaxID=641702 RepID=A0A840R2E6_9GAMM|nr:acyl-CoA dehydrogenase family protein [Zhongshania antarctica]MBB5187245.1 alkylation response protein AidB-like acyl-CoA dehydrogenase [Zhongshania antarctica]
MPLVLNEEQRLLKDTAKDFLNKTVPVEALRQLRDSKDALGYKAEHWQNMSELGWASMIIPEAYDGLDFSFLGLGAVLEESGRTLAASPLFASVVLGASAIIIGGNETQKATLLPQIASGNLRFALALDESAHHNPDDINCTATATETGYKLNGSKTFVLDGHSADQLIVVARSQPQGSGRDGLSLFIVDASTAGIERKRHYMLDSRNAASIQFNDVHVSREALLGDAGHGWSILDNVLDRGRICLAAEMLGGALECFERTVSYLKERDQFGVKIGTFQALQHRAAIMFTELELAKSVVLDGLSAIDENRTDLAQLASLAKARLNDVFELVTNEAVQMHGGIGVTDELDIGLFLKRSRVANQIFGNSSFHRDRYASLCGY